MKGATASKMPSGAGHAAAEDDAEAGLLGGTSESAQAMVDATASSLIREREQEAAEIAREMTEVADIMKDIAELTEEQDEGFVKLESNAAAAEAAAAAGNKHLDSAAKQQASYRRKVSQSLPANT
jgi:t-SNARE complex subunit (syntaxin)